MTIQRDTVQSDSMDSVQSVTVGNMAGIKVWSLAALLVALGAALHAAPWNTQLFRWINGGVVHWAWLASALSVMGLGAAMLVLAGALGLRRPQVPAAVLLAVVAGGLLVQLIKTLVASARPLAVLGADGVQVVGAALLERSMPSGHTALWAALATLLWLSPGNGGTPLLLQRHRLACCAMTVLAIAGALARVAVGAHWPADLLVGAGLGMLVGQLVAGTGAGQRLVQALAAGLRGRTGSRLMGAALVALSASLWVAERDGPAATVCHALLSLVGLVAAGGWWRLHRGPPWRWPGSVRRARKALP